MVETTGDTPARVELCSDAWLDLAAEIASDLVAKHGGEIVGETLTVCEVFHHPPAHLGHGERFVWTLVLAHDRASVERREIADADFRLEGEYDAALPSARRINPETIAPVSDGPLARASPAMRLILRRLHNGLAARTL